MTRHMALFGRGGVGVTTVASNISAALAVDGLKVVQVGCDPRHNSCGMNIPTVLDRLRAGSSLDLHDLIIDGYRGIQCIELGDPFTGTECASLAISRSLEALQHLDFVKQLAPDLVVYDIPWESGCSSFTSTFRTVPMDQILLVVTADFMSLYTANGILSRLAAGTGDGTQPPGIGLIANGLTNPFEESFVADYARKTGGRLAASIPKSLVVRQSELYGMTVIEADPLSNQASAIRRLSRQIAAGDAVGAITPLTPEALKRWARDWGDLLFEMENGLISDGAAI